MLEATLRERAKHLATASGRSDVPPFMVMDVMAAAARIEAGGGGVIYTETAKHLATASGRSDVPPFMVMDVMAAAARIEAGGGHVIHMEVGQPAAPAPKTALSAAHAALDAGRIDYTSALGIPSLRERIARHY